MLKFAENARISQSWFREYPKMAIPEKFSVWPLIHCYEFRPFQTKLMGGWPNFTIRPNFKILEYLEYLDLGQFRNFCDVFLLDLYNILYCIHCCTAFIGGNVLHEATRVLWSKSNFSPLATLSISFITNTPLKVRQLKWRTELSKSNICLINHMNSKHKFIMASGCLPCLAAESTKLAKKNFK